MKCKTVIRFFFVPLEIKTFTDFSISSKLAIPVDRITGSLVFAIAFRYGKLVNSPLGIFKISKFNEDKYEMSSLYEDKIKRMGNAGRNGGEYYTPRALIRAMIEVINPQVGETVYDPAVGSAGFLCECFDYMMSNRESLSTTDLQTIQEDTFFGKEKNKLPIQIEVE